MPFGRDPEEDAAKREKFVRLFMEALLTDKHITWVGEQMGYSRPQQVSDTAERMRKRGVQLPRRRINTALTVRDQENDKLNAIIKEMLQDARTQQRRND